MLKGERGSITIFTLVVMLFFTIVLMGVFVSANNARKAQKLVDRTIIDSYQKDVNMINEIYNEKELQYNKVKKNSAVKVNWDGENIVYNNGEGETATATATAYVEVLSDEVNINSSKCLVNTSASTLGVNSEEWESEDAVAITNKTGYIQTNVTYDTTFYVHVLIVKKDSTKEETVSDALKVSNNENEKVEDIVENQSIKVTSEEVNHWGGNGYPCTYQTKLYIENNNKDYSNWKVSFELPNGLIADNFNCWGASKIDVQGNIVTLYCQDWNSVLNNGDTLQIEMQMTFEDEVDLKFTNIKLNDELVSFK